MKVVIDRKVFDVLNDFYTISCREHVTLSFEECIAKINRLEHAMQNFSEYAEILHKVPYRKDWQELGFSEFFVENFHFAYRVYILPDGEKVLRYHDAVHSYLNYNPEDKSY